MLERHNPVDTARGLFENSGLDAIVEASRRAESCRREGDGAGVRYWNAVSGHMRELATSHRIAEPSLTSSIGWRLMQRVEHFRHRAAQCRSRAAEGSEGLRSEFLEAEQHWLELAAFAEILVGSATAPRQER